MSALMVDAHIVSAITGRKKRCPSNEAPFRSHELDLDEPALSRSYHLSSLTR
jgi:hypothetical protein